MSPQSFNNFLKALRDKGAIRASKDAEYDLDPRLIPEQTVVFKYEVDELEESDK